MYLVLERVSLIKSDTEVPDRDKMKCISGSVLVYKKKERIKEHSRLTGTLEYLNRPGLGADGTAFSNVRIFNNH